MRVLILGGTGWLSGRVARRWLDAGADVTCLARGARSAPAGAELVIADRADDDAYDTVAAQDWDEVVDVSSLAGHVAAAVTALGDRAGHLTYVSTVSVYRDAAVVGADETAALLEPAGPGDEDDYGRQKVAAEQAVRQARGAEVAVVRPGLIAGPGDPTDRFGYWVGRFALADSGAVLGPARDDLRVQVIDVDDLAAFVAFVGRDSWTGTVDAVGDSHAFSAVAEAARTAAGHTGDLASASDEWLIDQGVSYWAGPRSLPLWLPADMTGFATRSNASYRAAGGGIRPLADTLARTLADERARGLGRPRSAGLTRAEELELVARLG
ncbi:MAG TPA: NAD-dependent epimerase/dehydratase family protein [Microbacterium sp.]|nr:NAD-dependent epimerase/dehydratase family protein [Microbacterium sp.]